jgi:hypothetical protein
MPLLAALLAAGMLGVPAATAKDFGPGDLRICNAKHCVPVKNREVLPLLGSFYYSGLPPAVVRAPQMGAPMFELRFRNGYATGIVATRRLDRFLSYGVHLERFRRGKWYRVPARLAQELRRLSARLDPLRVTPAAVRKSR